MKKKILVVAALIVCIAILAAGTLAYYTSRTTAHNVITTGAVSIDVVEWQQEGDKLIPYPKDEPLGAMPGSTVSKIVTVQNNKAEAFVRARFEIIVTDAGGNVMDLSQAELARVISVTMPSGSGWQQKAGDTQWWYYVEPVATGEATEALFTEVVFDGPNMTNEYQNCTVAVVVYAQGVQTANNGRTALEAAGWPV